MVRWWISVVLVTTSSSSLLASSRHITRGGSSPLLQQKTKLRKYIPGESSDYSPGRIIVKLKESAGPQTYSAEPSAAFTSSPSLVARMQKFGVYEVEKVFPNDYGPAQPGLPDLSRLYVLDFVDAYDARRVAAAFAADEGIEYASPIYRRRIDFVPNDPLYSEQFHLRLINAAQAWDVTQGDTSVVIAVLDTGVDWTHEDLRANIWRNPGEIPGNGFDDDGNGFVDDIRGWDFADNDNDPRNPNSGAANHGTWVAGMASAVTNNNLDVAGVGFKCRVMPIKAQRTSSGGTSLDGLAILRGIRYAADNGADIINMSFGGGGLTTAELDAIEYAHSKGVVLVAAAGNDNSKQPSFPAADPRVLAVAATDNADRRASFSNYGGWVDLAAPGVAVLTTASPDTTVRVLGTSFSSPIVAGIAALVRSVHPDWTNDQIAQQVRATADDLSSSDPTFAPLLGKGRANAFRAVTAVTPSIRLVDIQMDDSAGDGDGIVDPGELIRITGTFKNFLEPADNVTLQLVSSDSLVNVVSGSIGIGRLGHNETRSNSTQPFEFRVSPNAENGHVLDLSVLISAPNYQDRDNFSLIVFPLYGDHDVGNVILTVTSFGALGFNDYANTGMDLGQGFRFPRNNPDRALFHGGFLVATDSSHVSDVSYGNSAHNHMDFKTIKGRELAFGLTQLSDQDGIAAFSDSVAERPIGIQVVQRSYSWASPPNDDFVILSYEVTNTGLAPVSGAYAAVYLDWDIGQVLDNQVEYDTETGVGYMFAPGSKLYGLATIEPATASGFRAVRNREFVWPDPTTKIGFTDAEKFRFMTEGFQLTHSPVADDWSVMMSVGPFDLAPNSSHKVAFALIGGENLDDLKANTRAARAIFTTLAVEDPGTPPTPPSTFALFQNHPNPFNPSTTIRYRVGTGSGPQKVRLQIYNLLGQKVRTLVDRLQGPGEYRVQWDGKDDSGRRLASGVYLYRLEAGRFGASRKMLLVR